MRKLIRGFNNLKIRDKFLIIYFISVLIPIIVSNSFFFVRTSETFLSQKRADVDLATEQTKESIKMVIDQGIGLSTSLYLDTRLYDFFNSDYDDVLFYINEYLTVVNQYRKTIPLYNSISDVQFFSDNPSLIFAGGINFLDLDSDEIPTLPENGQPFLVEEVENGDTALIIYRELDYFSIYQNHNTLARIEIDNRAIENILYNASLQGDVYLLDENGNVLFQTLENPETDDNIVYTQDYYEANGYYLSQAFFPDNYLRNWSVVTAVDEAIHNAELQESTKYILLIALMNFIFPTLLIVYISRSFHHRLYSILDHTKKISEKNFAEYPHVKSKDEIGQLATQINRMTRKINQLFNEVYKSNLEKKDLELREKQAQLSALQSQINPHFLFNALETIRMRSLIKEETETAAIIENMAGIFRNSLAWGRNWVTVSDEVRLIHAFLEIQAYRFGDKLKYKVHVDDDVFDYEIPNLAFLPFVENASIHGVEPSKGQGVIDVSIKRTEIGLRFIIEDNGIGIPETQLEKMLAELKEVNEMGDSVGIHNVFYRLKLHYKDRFGFKMESEEGIGTTITIDLPKQDSVLQPYLKKMQD